MLDRLEVSSGCLRQQRQQKQKILVHVPGVSLALTFFGSSDCSDAVDAVSFLRQQLEHEQHFAMRLQHGLQHLKQFMRLQQLGLPG